MVGRLDNKSNRTDLLTLKQFEMRIAPRKFSSYKCVGRAALAAIERKNVGENEKEKEKANEVTEEVIDVD
jgi:hypothetical protein